MENYGISVLFNMHKVTKKIQQFYEEYPFPSYGMVHTSEELYRLGNREGCFTEFLNSLIFPNSLVLECGCGTGQLSTFLSMDGATVIGTDVCHKSLEIANKFKNNNNLKNVSFIQMDLFNPCLEEVFDVVICNGVLHHTFDPEHGFDKISKLLKHGGLIVIGLYHKSRFFTKWFKALIEKKRNSIWYMDQYRHPHESLHTVKEVKKWFYNNRIGVTNVIVRNGFFIMMGVKI